MLKMENEIVEKGWWLISWLEEGGVVPWHKLFPYS